MNYLLKNNLRPRNKNWRLKIALIILIFVTLFFISRANVFKEFLNKVALPFWRIDNYAVSGFSGFFSVINSKRSLIFENRALKEELDRTKADSSIRKILQKENEDLKILLGRNDARKNVILAAVLVKPGISPFDIIIIDTGKNKGVKKGDKVLFENALTIGEIEETYEGSSKVRLYSSPGEKTIAFVGPTSMQVEAEGYGGGNFIAKLPRGLEVKEGDEVMMPGISTSILGLVEKIKTSPADSFQEIIFKIPVNLAELKWVLVEI